jgi:hypothetical protein
MKRVVEGSVLERERESVWCEMAGRYLKIFNSTHKLKSGVGENYFPFLFQKYEMESEPIPTKLLGT